MAPAGGGPADQRGGNGNSLRTAIGRACRATGTPLWRPARPEAPAHLAPTREGQHLGSGRGAGRQPVGEAPLGHVHARSHGRAGAGLRGDHRRASLRQGSRPPSSDVRLACYGDMAWLSTFLAAVIGGASVLLAAWGRVAHCRSGRTRPLRVRDPRARPRRHGRVCFRIPLAGGESREAMSGGGRVRALPPHRSPHRSAEVAHLQGGSDPVWALALKPCKRRAFIARD